MNSMRWVRAAAAATTTFLFLVDGRVMAQNGGAGQTPKEEAREERRPARRRTLLDQLSGDGQQKVRNDGGGVEWMPPAGAEPPTPAPPGRPAPSPLDDRIRLLDARIQTATGGAPAGVTSPAPLPQLLESAARYRTLYEVMREQLFVDALAAPDTTALQQFVDRWESLAPKLRAGDRAAATITVPEWDGVVERVRRHPCPVPASLPDRVATGALEGPAWACLNDTFFAELANHEAVLNDKLAAERVRLLLPVGRAVADLDEWMARTEGLQRVAPESLALRRELAGLLFRTWLAGTTAHRDELVRERARRADTPLERFLALATPAGRPAGLRPVQVPPGTMLRLRLGQARSALPVADAPYEPGGRGLARQLHDIHYLNRTLEKYVAGQMPNAPAVARQARIHDDRAILAGRREDVLEQMSRR